MVPDRADTWTRMSYLGPNKPVTPIDDPYQMFRKLYGQEAQRENLISVLDDVERDLKRLSQNVGTDDRQLIEEHAAFVRKMEQELEQARSSDVAMQFLNWNRASRKRTTTFLRSPGCRWTSWSTVL